MPVSMPSDEPSGSEAPGAQASPIIDCVVSPSTPLEVAQGQLGVDEAFMDKVRMSAEVRRGVEMEAYVGKMDRAGIATSLLIAVAAGDMRVKGSFAIPYDRVADYCARFPGRFRGVAGIDVSRTMPGLRELERGVRELGFVAAHLYPHWFELAPDHARYYPFYAKCCELDIPIMMQVGHCLDYQRDRVLPSVGRPSTLDRVAIDFPELKIIGIHQGWPWVEEMIALCFKHNNVYVCGDAYAPSHWDPRFIHYANTFGQDKVVFGTDWPVIDPERAVAEVQALGMRPVSHRKMMSENARALFRLEEVG
jgi:predicted TIM-barrel fold metal-dependent hydrolase